MHDFHVSTSHKLSFPIKVCYLLNYTELQVHCGSLLFRKGHWCSGLTMLHLGRRSESLISQIMFIIFVEPLSSIFVIGGLRLLHNFFYTHDNHTSLIRRNTNYYKGLKELVYSVVNLECTKLDATQRFWNSLFPLKAKYSRTSIIRTSIIQTFRLSGLFLWFRFFHEY